MSKAIIIGGGIGGLAAAAALARVGIECEVFEQAEELREVGAGLIIWANAIGALGQLGIAETLLCLGSRIETFEVRSWSGRVLTSSNYISLARKLGVAACVVLHRAVLLQALARLTDGSRLHCNNRCIKVEEAPGKVMARFADGKEVCADF